MYAQAYGGAGSFLFFTERCIILLWKRENILTKFKNNEISLEEAEHYFRKEPFEEMGGVREAGFSQRNTERISGSYLLQQEGGRAFCADLQKAV